MKFHPRRLKGAFKTKVRNKAISRTETRIILAGRKVEELNEDELEVIVREEEDKIYSQLKEKGLMAAVAILGIGWWV